MLLFLNLPVDEQEKTKIQQIYELYRDDMLITANAILKRKDLAEEAVQEAVLRIMDRLEDLEEPTHHSVRSFVNVVVRNVAVNMSRTEKRTVALEDETIRPIGIRDDYSSLEVEDLLEIIRQMPYRLRDVLWLKIYYDLTDQQIAKALGIHHATVRKRLQRAKEYLMEQRSDDDV